MFIFFIKGDVSLLGFKRHKAHESAPPPLTDQEKELELVKQQEVRIITVLFSQFYFEDTRSFAYWGKWTKLIYEIEY